MSILSFFSDMIRRKKNNQAIEYILSLQQLERLGNNNPKIIFMLDDMIMDLELGEVKI